MSSKKIFVAVVPARKNSKGIKNKIYFIIKVKELLIWQFP